MSHYWITVIRNQRPSLLSQRTAGSFHMMNPKLNLSRGGFARPRVQHGGEKSIEQPWVQICVKPIQTVSRAPRQKLLCHVFVWHPLVSFLNIQAPLSINIWKRIYLTLTNKTELNLLSSHQKCTFPSQAKLLKLWSHVESRNSASRWYLGRTGRVVHVLCSSTKQTGRRKHLDSWVEPGSIPVCLWRPSRRWDWNNPGARSPDHSGRSRWSPAYSLRPAACHSSRCPGRNRPRAV